MDLLHEAKAVDDLVNTVVSIFPGVNLHPALPALETQTNTHKLAYRKHEEVQSWHNLKQGNMSGWRAASMKREDDLTK